MSNITFQVCTPADRDKLRNLAETTYRDAFARFNTPADMDLYVQAAFSPQQVEKELTNRQSIFIMALLNGQPAGYIKLNYGAAQTELQDENALEVERIYVLQKYQSQGMGQQLLEYAIRQAEKDNLQYVWLGVWENNPGAIRFYERNGFSRFGEHAFYLGEDKQTDYMLRKYL